MKTGLTVAFRCDASARIGFGHVVRCLALADEMRRLGARCVFLMKEPAGLGAVGRAGFEAVRLAGPFDRAVEAAGARAVVLDVRDDLPRAALRALRGRGIVVATIDDPSDRRLDADLVFCPPVPQFGRMSWRGFAGRKFVGWKWVVLRRQFSAARKSRRSAGRTPRILVTMGGSDPAGLTFKAVRALESLDVGFRADVVLGPAFRGQLGRLDPRFRVLHSVTNMRAMMDRADLAVASFGVTAYELAAAGVPAIHLCLTPDHAESASAFVKAGIAASLGVHRRVSKRRIASAIEMWLADTASRRAVAARARKAVDGRGAERIARLIMEKAQRLSLDRLEVVRA